MTRHATALETICLAVPDAALEAYEAALREACGTVAFFRDDDAGDWHLEGVKERGANEPALVAALALAAAATGVPATFSRHDTPAEGWLARTRSAFPEQFIGRRFAVRGTHIEAPLTPGRLPITLDAALAFGSGEHGSTRGCLRALERIAWRRPRRILDLGTGSGILAMATALLLHRPVLGTDIDPWSVRTARENARRNGLGNLVRLLRADGWKARRVRAGGPYDLVFANILAPPLCAMAVSLAHHLAPGGVAVLAGLLDRQANWVLAAHRRQGLRLEFALHDGGWSTLVLSKARALPSTRQRPEALGTH
jgi:ribosomal protein L11 methyltransferase